MRGPGTGTASGSDAVQQIADCVEGNFPQQTIDGTTVYDLSGR